MAHRTSFPSRDAETAGAACTRIVRAGRGLERGSAPAFVSANRARTATGSAKKNSATAAGKTI